MSKKCIKSTNEMADFSISPSIYLLRMLAQSMGDMPNIPMKTLGGKYFWDTVMEAGGMRLQVYKVTGHARILDEDNRRLAWGKLSVMQEKLNRLVSDSFLIPGDVIGIKRRLGYEHYAVYAGDDMVIHFAAEDGDFGTPYIHKAPMDDFLDGQDRFFVLDFKSGISASKIYNDEKMHPGGKGVTFGFGKVYSPEETLRRAESVIGANEHNYKEKYNLAFNNCEHFAIWCKTGLKRSSQVEKILGGIATTWYMTGSLLEDI